MPVPDQTTEFALEANESSSFNLPKDPFSAIRMHTRSKIPQQKHMALLLQAIESSIQETMKEQLSPLSYFGSLMTLLDDHLKQETLDLEMLTSLTYLLALIAPG